MFHCSNSSTEKLSSTVNLEKTSKLRNEKLVLLSTSTPSYGSVFHLIEFTVSHDLKSFFLLIFAPLPDTNYHAGRPMAHDN